MLKDAPLLILDEATSALDSEVENAIQDNLYQLMQGKTVIAIAHRLSTIAAMDKPIVMDKGQIIEQGSHEQLLEQDAFTLNSGVTSQVAYLRHLMKRPPNIVLSMGCGFAKRKPCMTPQPI